MLILSRNSFEKQVEDPSCDYHLDWIDKPTRVLLMKKFRDPDVTSWFKKIAKWLIEVCFYTKCFLRGNLHNCLLQVHDIEILCEPAVVNEPQILEDSFKTISSQLVTWEEGKMYLDM